MIKKFKIFEKLISERYSIAKDLVDQFDDTYIEKWYDDNFDMDVSEIIDMSSTRNILDCFDDDRYRDDYIQDYINSYEFSEIDKDDLKRYIEKNLTTKKEDKILEIYNSNNYDEDDEDSKKETEYEDYMLDELDQDELRDVIDDSNEESDCIEELINGWYSGRSGEDILEEFHGNVDRTEARELYDIISYYVDDDKLKQNWQDNKDFDYKKERLEEDLPYNVELQRDLIDKDADNAVALADLWENESSSQNIGDEYDFQKGYIEKYTKDNTDENDDEEFVSDIKSDAVKYLYDNFGLDSNIEEEYEDYMWKVTASIYNV